MPKRKDHVVKRQTRRLRPSLYTLDEASASPLPQVDTLHTTAEGDHVASERGPRCMARGKHPGHGLAVQSEQAGLFIPYAKAIEGTGRLGPCALPFLHRGGWRRRRPRQRGSTAPAAYRSAWLSPIPRSTGTDRPIRRPLHQTEDRRTACQRLHRADAGSAAQDLRHLRGTGAIRQ